MRKGTASGTAHPRKVRYSEREVDGVFLDRERLNGAVSALVGAGFGLENMSVVLEQRGTSSTFSAVDERQLRTLGTSLVAAVGALAAAGLTLMSGGAAAAAIAASALVGGSAATGVHVFKTSKGFNGSGATPDRPDEDAILSVRVGRTDDEHRTVEILQEHGAVKIWAQNWPY
jgi:hypothetical protein